MSELDPYHLDEATGVMVAPVAAAHRDHEYDSSGHRALLTMQRDHFWYRGRHRFLLYSVRRWALPQAPRDRVPWVIDLGGGCGGWIHYLLERGVFPDAEVALADSSVSALQLARSSLPPRVRLYQSDLVNLQWRDRWDCVFLLDVLEHIPDHESALREIYKATTPGGTLFITVPALMAFWSYVDEAGHHQRRYSRSGLAALASSTGWEVLDCRYFMFFLSPLLWVRRFIDERTVGKLAPEDRLRLAQRSDSTPSAPVNAALSAVFAAESPLGHYVHFPWGTSLLAVLRKSSL